MGALEGLKILDFTTLLPGPFATLTLADLGAEVVSVSRPGNKDLVKNWGKKIEGADITGPAAWLGRNKKSICLDLKDPESIDILKRLVKEYDIVIEQFRPGVMDRLGLGYNDLVKIKENLIYCSITGYGQTGELKDRAGHDCNYLARSGILAAAGRKESGPALYNFQIADVASGSSNAVIAILAAVYHRMRTGEGQYIDISMSDGVIPFHSMDGASWLAGGTDCLERESGILNGGGIYDYYETADGGYLSIGSLEPKFFSSLCETLELDEPENRNADTEREYKELIRRKIQTKTREEWIEIFAQTDCCVEAVYDMKEAVHDKHLNEREMWPEVPFAHCDGSVKQMGCPIKMSKTPVTYRHAGVPDGYHTEEMI